KGGKAGDSIVEYLRLCGWEFRLPSAGHAVPEDQVKACAAALSGLRGPSLGIVDGFDIWDRRLTNASHRNRLFRPPFRSPQGDLDRDRMLRMQGEIRRALHSSRQQTPDSSGEGPCRALGGTGGGIHKDAIGGAIEDHEPQPQSGRLHVANASRDVAISFLRLANLQSDIVDRLSRYEAALWRQLAQALFTVQALKRP